jgi:glycosyltransferase involved in cell wall biosynthesis
LPGFVGILEKIMKILQVAPLWEDVPPKTYGGTELIVYNLCEELIKRGHDVSLIATKNSRSSANIISPLEKTMREMRTIIPGFYEGISIAKTIEISEKFDVIHNHCGLSMLPFHKLFKAPVLTTLHGAFTLEEDIKAHKKYKHLPFISISNSQRRGNHELNYISTVYNGIDIENYEFQAKSDDKNRYIAFLGRISYEKGIHHAITLAEKIGWKLIIAAKIDVNDREYYEKQIKPRINNENIVYIGEIGHKEKVEFLKNAYAVVHAVTWPEPFGLVMAESMACGTPVLALNKGSVPEVIKNGVTGFVEEKLEDLIERFQDIPKISRRACREHVEKNFSRAKMTENYIEAYYRIMQ